MNFLTNFNLVTLLILLSIGQARGADAIVVVSNQAGSLDLNLLRDIYFQNGGRLKDGRVVTPVDFREDFSLRDRFYSSAFGKSRMQVKAHWAQKIFTGKGNPPIAVENEKSALSILQQEKTELFITYLNESDVPKDVHVLLKIEN